MTSRVTTETLNKIDVAAIAADLAPILADLTKFLESPEAQRNALALFVTTRAGALAALRMTEGESRATAIWEGMDWKQRFKFLAQIKTSNAVLVEMGRIIESGPHSMFVTKGLEFIQRAEQCRTLREFSSFMADAEESRQVRRNGSGFDTITVYIAREEVHYVPDTPVTKAAWPYVLAAWMTLRKERDEAREALVKKAQEFASSEATPSLTLSDIVDSHKEGKIVLGLDYNRVALLEFSNVVAGLATVEILGTNYNRLTWRKMDVDLSDFAPLKGTWPSDNYGFRRALREQLEQARSEKKLQERLADFRRFDLLPEEPEHRSMTRVLLGETGSALAYHKTFVYGNEEPGFFGIVLLNQGGVFILSAVDSDQPFPQTLLMGKELPLAVQDNGEGKEPYIVLEPGSDVPEDEKKALAKIKRLLIMRVRLENQSH